MYFPLVACALDVRAKNSRLSRHLSPSSLFFCPPALPSVPPLEPSPQWDWGSTKQPPSIFNKSPWNLGRDVGNCAGVMRPLVSASDTPPVATGGGCTQPDPNFQVGKPRHGTKVGREQDLPAPCVGTTAEVTVPTLACTRSWLGSCTALGQPARNRLLLHLVPAETKTPRRREEKHSQGSRRWGRSRFLSASLPVLMVWGWGGHIVSRPTSRSFRVGPASASS